MQFHLYLLYSNFKIFQGVVKTKSKTKQLDTPARRLVEVKQILKSNAFFISGSFILIFFLFYDMFCIGGFMLPFYFLSIALNIFAGAIFVFLDPKESFEQNIEPREQFAFMRESKFLLIMTIASGVVAVMKILLPVKGLSGTRLFVIGDFLPVFAGILACLIFASRYASKTDDSEKIPAVLKVVVSYERYIGFFCIAVAGLHFLFSYLPVL
ncbi:MAG: hypothetical protein CR988_02815 [Treponema sp.]|nr:MAG: hypothetical protein CR988_02815 [Treponema sp.]